MDEPFFNFQINTIMNKSTKKKIILLYSGGLDTSVLLTWIQEHYQADVITVTVDLGQTKDSFTAIKHKALSLGALKAYIIDAKKEFAEQYLAPAIKANALYQGIYPLSTALGRPLLAKIAVDIAHQEQTTLIAHGCTGKGNDQVRLEISAKSIDPHIQCIAPVREWNMGRDEEITYAKDHNIPIPVTVDSPYSIDDNMWGKSTEGGIIEHPDQPIPQAEVTHWVTLPEEAPDTPQEITIGFQQGVPTALNGQPMHLVQLITELNAIAAAHGVGIIEHIEDRIVGIKVRDYYECPAATVLLLAHQKLQHYVSTIHENSFASIIQDKWAYLVYAGLWYEPLLQHLNAFITAANNKVTGDVTVKLYKGSATVISRTSPYALYDTHHATFMADHTLDQKDAVGFIKHWGLQTILAQQINQHNHHDHD